MKASHKEQFLRAWTLFRCFCGITMVALGGGIIMMPICQKEFVDKRKWMTNEEMLDVVAIMQSLPGLIAANMSILIGYRIAGFPGAIASLLGIIVPPFITIVLVMICLANVLHSTIVQNMFAGIRAGVCAMILMATIRMGRKVLKAPFECAIALMGFMALLFTNIHILWLIVAAAALGIILTLTGFFRAREQLDATQCPAPGDGSQSSSTDIQQQPADDKGGPTS